MIGFCLQRAFPNGDDIPAEGVELRFLPQVPRLVSFDLRFPKMAAGFREAEGGAVFMPMPEAAMDEECLIADC